MLPQITAAKDVDEKIKCTKLHLKKYSKIGNGRGN